MFLNPNLFFITQLGFLPEDNLLFALLILTNNLLLLIGFCKPLTFRLIIHICAYYFSFNLLQGLSAWPEFFPCNVKFVKTHHQLRHSTLRCLPPTVPPLPPYSLHLSVLLQISWLTSFLNISSSSLFTFVCVSNPFPCRQSLNFLVSWR